LRRPSIAPPICRSRGTLGCCRRKLVRMACLPIRRQPPQQLPECHHRQAWGHQACCHHQAWHHPRAHQASTIRQECRRRVWDRQACHRRAWDHQACRHSACRRQECHLSAFLACRHRRLASHLLTPRAKARASTTCHPASGCHPASLEYHLAFQVDLLRASPACRQASLAHPPAFLDPPQDARRWTEALLGDLLSMGRLAWCRHPSMHLLASGAGGRRALRGQVQQGLLQAATRQRGARGPWSRATSEKAASGRVRKLSRSIQMVPSTSSTTVTTSSGRCPLPACVRSRRGQLRRRPAVVQVL